MFFLYETIAYCPLALLTVALAGCSGAQPGSAGSNAAATGTITTQEATIGEKVPSNPGTGIIKSTTMTSCDTKEGDVSAVGRVTLPQDVKGSVKVSVSWVDPKPQRVLAQAAQTLKDAQPGKATDWKLSTKLGKVSTEVRCVLGSMVLPEG